MRTDPQDAFAGINALRVLEDSSRVLLDVLENFDGGGAEAIARLKGHAFSVYLNAVSMAQAFEIDVDAGGTTIVEEIMAIRPWQTGTEYEPGIPVWVDGEMWRCKTPHTSSVWLDDAANWDLVYPRSKTGYISTSQTITPSRPMLYVVNTLAGPVDLTIDGRGAMDGLTISIKKVGGLNHVRILFTGGGVIDGEGELFLYGDMESITITYDYDAGLWWRVD